jgi:MYXO-CTERM domain-containing protein
MKHLSSSLNRARAAAAACSGALALVAPGLAQATELTFEGISQLGFGNGEGFGDRVTAASTGLNLNGGATPNVLLDFVPTGSTSPFTVYVGGYATLVSALGHGSFNVPGYVQLTPDAGWDVVIERFDIGGWSVNSYPNSRIQIVDTTGAVHFDTGLFTFPPSTVQTWAGPAIRSSLPLRLVVADFGDLGLDNLRFSQVATIPEPETWALWLAGLAMAAGVARRRQLRTAQT